MHKKISIEELEQRMDEDNELQLKPDGSIVSKEKSVKEVGRMITEEQREKLEELVGEALGAASMCWSETPKGVFDSKEVSKIANMLVNDIEILINNK